MEAHHLTLSFYGVGVSVESEEDGLLRTIEHAFSYFASPIDRCDLRIIYHPENPDYDRLPVMTASMATPRNICFRREGKTYIDYFGKALNVYEKNENTCHIYTEDAGLAHEISYLTILSRVSEKLDKKRIHRIHALGIEHHGRGILILLPAGGGKTTLAMSILQSDDHRIKLISEDSPLIKSDGTLLPFPLRIGVHPRNLPAGIDERFTRFERRMEYDPKVTIDIRYFADKISSEGVRPCIMLLGTRSTGEVSQIAPIAKAGVIKHCLMNSVVGVGLYQGMEFIMQKNAPELASQAGVLLSRMYNNLRLVMKSKVYSFTIGRNPLRNYSTLRQFLDDFPEGRRR